MSLPTQEQTAPRFGVLAIPAGYVVVDTWLARLADGVYALRRMALAAARHYEQAGCPGDRAPTAAALGLLFPTCRADKEERP